MKRSRNFRAILAVGLVVLTVFTGYLAHRDSEEARVKQVVEKYRSQGPLIYGADDSSPPMRFMDSDGVYKGVVVDYINLIAIELGIEIDTKPYKFSEGLGALAEGETDICDIFSNPERSKVFEWSDSIYNIRTVLTVNEGSDISLEDIDGLKVATQEGDYANWYMETNHPDAELIYVHDIGQALDYLTAGLVDAVIGDEPVTSYYINNKNLLGKVKILDKAVYEEDVYLAVPKDEEDLLIALNYAIDKIKSRGQLENIQQKWFGISTPLTENVSHGWVNYLLAGITIVAAVFLYRKIETKTLRKLVRERTAELEKSNSELERMFDEIPESVIVIDKDRRVTSYNYAARELGGGREPDKAEYGYVTNGIDDGSIRAIVEETFTGHRDGETTVSRGGKTYECRSYYIDAKSSGFESVMLTVKDVTLEVVKNSQILRTSKMIAVGQLAGGMAHQIRNPLGIIRTQSFILRRKGLVREEGLASLDYIDENVSRAEKIISNVMDFWRISGTDVEKINLNGAFEKIAGLLESRTRKLGIKMIINADEEVEIYSNSESIKHIFMNILENAVDAVEGRENPTVEIILRKSGENAEIFIRDNGIGVKEEDIDSLFNPFFTTKPQGKGTGLGLFITYSELENIGGTIDVSSEYGAGTTFRIEIPVGDEHGQKDLQNTHS